ncbi:MAG: aminoglycoside phosphotransferase family protein [Bacilli bacterium]|nr:aminoglycoside phosphotransferase family protein [Bacilli bacterium]
MGKKYKKWRSLEVDPFVVDFKKIKIKSIISYPPAGNDVIECKCYINNILKNVFIKFERSKMANFDNEIKSLKLISEKGYCNKTPIVIESGKVDNKEYIVLDKLDGERLSDIFNRKITKAERKEYLIKYGRELSLIHNIPYKEFGNAMQRKINDVPKEKNDSKFDNLLMPYIKYLEDNKPKIDEYVFIHGDFHYANLLWQNKELTGILDLEYCGKGFKEQDIAWACVLRPTQYFMDNIEDIKNFLKGYLINGTFDKEKLRWCLINGYCHFYLMNMDNDEYKNKIQKLIIEIENFMFEF